MDFLSSHEMKTQLFFKFYSAFSKQSKKIKVKSKVSQKDQENLKFDFAQLINKLDYKCLNSRMNIPRNWKIPECYFVKPKPNHLIGNINRIDNILSDFQQFINKEVYVSGWCRTARLQQNDTLIFIQLNDGSCQKCIQIVIEKSIPNFDQLIKIQKDYSLKICGTIVKSLGKDQDIEILVNDPKKHSVVVLGECENKKYPLAKGHPTLEFLRDNAHLRARSNIIGSIARIRNNLAFATHLFFQNNGFLYIHTPLITTSDCEGAGELFQVTTAMQEFEKTKQINYNLDFFKKPAFLTCSGQLNVETYSCALSNVYTFGPTFRAENSNTNRHLAEFWMIEPEISFCDLIDDMDCAEEYVKFCLKYVLDNNSGDLDYLTEFNKKDLKQYLNSLIKDSFARITYTDAVEILKSAVSQGKIFEHEPKWGEELYTEHEKFLAESVFYKPVIVYNYPKSFKAFYMRLNEDQQTVASMDILAPQVGELIGGSQREERIEVLEKRMKEMKLNPETYYWYMALRKYGTVPHAGFGLGFERLVMVSTGVENIRDVIPFPRYPGNADF